MGQTIVKIAPDRDEYVIWSSSTETPVWLGTAAELIEELGDVDGECPTCHQWTTHGATTRARIARADVTGSSSYYGAWRWDGPGSTGQHPSGPGGPYKAIYAQLGLVGREHLPAIVEMLADGADVDDPRIVALLEPLDDEPLDGHPTATTTTRRTP